MGDYYEAVVSRVPGHEKLAANWVMGELSAALNKDGIEVTQSRIDARRLAGLLARIADETISGKIAKEVFEQMWAEGQDADAIIEAKGLKQITDTSAIEKTIDEVMAANPKQLADYRSGKDKLFGFFVGQVMKVTGGKANPAQVNELLKKKLARLNALMHDRDCLHRFLFEHYPIRGHIVHLDASWRALLEHRDYPPAIRDTLGEAVAASVLLAATLKFDGTLSLQLQGQGPMHLMLAQCSSELGVRAVARYREDA